MKIIAGLLLDNFNLLLLSFILRLGVFLFQNIVQRFHIFILCNPEQMLIEFCKYFIYSPLPIVILVRLGDFDGRIDDLHDELGVISILLKDNLLFPILILFDLQIVAYLYSIGKNQVIFLIIDPVDFVDYFPHPGSSA